MSRNLRTLLVASVYGLLGGWVGALLLFALVVAPTAFSVLPNSEMAGKVVGPVLRSLNLYGAVAGLFLAALAWTLRRGPVAVGIPLVLALLCLVSQFGITSAIEEIRPLAFGPEPQAAALVRFGELHRWSMVLFGVTGISTLVLCWVHASGDATAP